MIIILLGAPGSGKGTQSAALSARAPSSVRLTEYARRSSWLLRRCRRPFLSMRLIRSAIVDRSMPVFSTRSVWLSPSAFETVRSTMY